MHTKLTCALIATLSSSILAQGYMTTPLTGTTVEGADSAFIFGWAANQGNRFMDYTHTGTKRSIKGLAFRADYRDHNAIGRTWSKVTVLAAHGDWSSITKLSPNYTLKDTPTKVFDAKWSFPALKGKPLLNPSAWGGIGGSLNFRFSTPWAYNGSDSIFLEFQFSGGVAANNQPWVGANPKGFEYFLDTMPQAAWQGTNTYNQTYPAKPAPCLDSGFGSGGKGKTYATIDASLSGATTVVLAVRTYYTSTRSPVIYALGVAGNATGLNLGAGCNLFHIDSTKPMYIVPLATPNNKTAYASLTAKTPRQSWMKEIWAQAGWADSKTQSLKLTHAVRATFGTSTQVPASTSYTTPKFSVWNQAPKGLPFMRYEY